ncbi:MAG: hypothetical protein V1735_05260 [Nanoarchaeota archaeon]
MLGFFRKRDAEEMSSRVEQAFSKVDTDLRHVQTWINHVQDRHQELEMAHQDHLSITRRDVQHLNSWVQYLHKHLSGLHGGVKQLSEGLKMVQESQNRLSQRLESLEQKSHFLGLEQPKQALAPPRMVPKGPDTGMVQLHNVDLLSPSERDVVRVLVHSPEPLDYHALASKLGLNYTTVKNLIYRMKKKGFVIRNRLNAQGEKEFFLDQMFRIRVSGR